MTTSAIRKMWTVLCLNLIIVSVAREIGDFRKKFSEILPSEILNPIKDPFDFIKEKGGANDKLPPIENAETTETVKEDDNNSTNNTSVKEKVSLTDSEDNVTEIVEEIKKDLPDEDVFQDVAKTEETSTDEDIFQDIARTEETSSNKDSLENITTEKVPSDEVDKIESKKSNEDEVTVLSNITEEPEITTNGENIDEDSDNDKKHDEVEPPQEDQASEKNFETNRDKLIKTEEEMAFGSDVVLNDDEKLVNDTLMEEKFKEIDEGFADQGKFLPRSNFLRVKDEIEKSKVFQMIKKMPKGSLLHAHDVGTVSQEFVLNNITYRPNLYACESNESLKLQFFETPDNKCDWKLLSELRETPESENEINQRIQEHISMNTKNPEKAYPDGDRAWIKFQSLFEFLGSFMRYRPVYESYYYQLLQENYDDKVLYIELRVSLPKVYELNGYEYAPIEVVEIIKNVVDRFMEDHPDFVGVKIIYSKRRLISNEKLQKYLQTFQEIKEAYPDFIAGFDLVGQEDKGIPLKNFTNQLRSVNNEYQTFFHAGETDWYGLSTDENLIDAVLMNTRRIGHGYALPKHPKVMELVKQKNIAIEVNPISNQILNLVADLRNHPASILFAENYPVVVCSDDPGLWGAKGLSYDFYEAFMGIMSRSSDLRALIQLGHNSITYSAMNDEEKERAFEIFDEQWTEFVENSNEKDFEPYDNYDSRK